MHQDRVEVVWIVVVVLICCFYLFLYLAEFILNISATLLHHLIQLLDNLLRLSTLLCLRVNAFPNVSRRTNSWVISPLPSGGNKFWRTTKRDVLAERDALHEVGGFLDALNEVVLIHLLKIFPENDSLLLQLGRGSLDGRDPPNVILKHLVDVDALFECELFAVLHNLLLLFIVADPIQGEEEDVRRVFNPELILALHLLRRANIYRLAERLSILVVGYLTGLCALPVFHQPIVQQLQDAWADLALQALHHNLFTHVVSHLCQGDSLPIKVLTYRIVVLGLLRDGRGIHRRYSPKERLVHSTRL